MKSKGNWVTHDKGITMNNDVDYEMDVFVDADVFDSISKEKLDRIINFAIEQSSHAVEPETFLCFIQDGDRDKFYAIDIYGSSIGEFEDDGLDMPEIMTYARVNCNNEELFVKRAILPV